MHARRRARDQSSIDDRTESMRTVSPSRWDVFCSVVDNYGDAGVAWRLARQLASEHGIAVRIWADDLRTLSRMEPRIDPARENSLVDGVGVRRWARADDGSAADEVADVVVEVFGCGIPASYAAAMATRPRPPAWIILEYLSAESWVDTHHGLPSPHPETGLERHFFFPGFTPATGGLLRESGLLARRDAFLANDAARAAFWRALGVARRDDGSITVSLFCYPDAPLHRLLDAWADGDNPVTCLVPEGVAAGTLDRWTGGKVPHPGQPLMRGRLVVNAIPFLPQDDYDRLLWASDVNFVRGEDSFVRAQWAARPLVWNAYAQSESAHAAKVNAFLARYEQGLDADAAAALHSFFTAWNANAATDPPAAARWSALAATLPSLEKHARDWSQTLAGVVDLTSALVKFVSNRV